MKLFKQLFVVGLTFYLFLGCILSLVVYNITLHFSEREFKHSKEVKKEVVVETVSFKLDEDKPKPKNEPVVIPKVEKKDTQSKQKEIELVKDSSMLSPIQDSLK